jgi:hypothetical protein
VCHACNIELPHFLSAVGIHEGNTEKIKLFFFITNGQKIIVLLLITTLIIGLLFIGL